MTADEATRRIRKVMADGHPCQLVINVADGGRITSIEVHQRLAVDRGEEVLLDFASPTEAFSR